MTNNLEDLTISLTSIRQVIESKDLEIEKLISDVWELEKQEDQLIGTISEMRISSQEDT